MAIELFPLAISENILTRLVNELWKNPNKAQKLELIQAEDAKCTMKAYEQTIAFMQEKMNGADHEEIFLVLESMGWRAAFIQARATFKQKRKQETSVTAQHILYQKLANFLKAEFYAYIGYDGSQMSSSQFFALMEEGEAKLAIEMKISSPDSAGNLVFLSHDRLKPKELLALVPQMKEMGFIPTLLHIKALTRQRKY